MQADLKTAFDRLGARIGYESLAAGVDIMAAEVLLDRGAELHVTLPFDREEFVRASVAPARLAWVRRFDRCLASAPEVVTAVLSEYLDDPTFFDFCARIAMGDALVRARQLEADVCHVAVWDGVETEPTAGTSVDVARWKAGGHPATIIASGRTALASNGQVYVTHPFAALAALAGDLSIACQYVGTLPTAKGYGSLPLYALHQKL